jgi:hypothetical protein
MRTVLARSHVAAGLGLATGLSTIALVVGLAGCEKKQQEAGLPPATDWKAPSPGTGAPAADPHAGLDMGKDPHAGLDMSGAGGNPHGGGSGVDVTTLGLPSPDRTKPVDASKFLKGAIKGTPITEPKMARGGVIFISVRKAGPDGNPVGAPIAVERLTIGGWPTPFELTEANAMIGGTGFSGDVVIMARYDQDGDALSKSPGDVTGQAKATIPADKLTVVLDTVLP